MRKFKLIIKISLMLLTIFTIFLKIQTTEVKAVSTSDLYDAASVLSRYDGIRWTQQTNMPPNQVGEIPLNDNVSLGYTFGAARDKNGNVVTGGDTTITKASTTGTENGAPIIKNSKVNVFIDNNGTYYGVIHQGANSYIGSDPGNASNTSIDFALLTGSANPGTTFTSSMNLLVQSASLDSSSNATKLFYTGTSNGHLALRLVGYNAKIHSFYEILLRAAPHGDPIVQRELYVYNPESSSVQFQTFFGEDTGLTSLNSGTDVDNVPMKAIGGGKGLYIESGSKDFASPASKLYITNEIADGFKDFMGRVLTPSDWSVKGKQGYGSSSDIVSPKLTWGDSDKIGNQGDTADAAGTDLLQMPNYKVVDKNDKQDTAYILRWPESTVPAGGVAHFGSNIGAMLSGLAVPLLSQSYKNITNTNGTNNVGDNLQFTFTLKNTGYNSSWIIDKILDSFPKGLKITSSVINNSNNTIDGAPSSSAVKDGTSDVLTVDATITNEAPLNNDGNLVNTVTYTGHTSGKSDTQSISSSIKIPVKIPNFNYSFQNYVKNETTNADGDYASKVTAHKDDVIDYKVDFNSTGSDSLKDSYFYDVIPDGLEIVPNSFALNGTSITNSESGNKLGFMTGSLNNNTDNIITFKAKVTSPTALTASNTAQLTHITTSQKENVSTINAEEPAIVDIQAVAAATAFKEVPSNIDFGSINSVNLEKLLLNKSTTGKLLVSHGSATPFDVDVSYDNNGSNSIASNGKKLIQDNGDSLLFNQADTNTWASLSSAETPIKTDGFNGSYDDLDLTKYVGSDKWKLRVPAATEAGEYNGQITWAIADTPQ